MREVAVRTVCTVDGLVDVFVGLVVMLATGDRRQRLGDIAAGTVVAADAAAARRREPRRCRGARAIHRPCSHLLVSLRIADPRDGRSTHYASDLAKGFEVPIVHVNGDDAEACISGGLARARLSRAVP